MASETRLFFPQQKLPDIVLWHIAPTRSTVAKQQLSTINMYERSMSYSHIEHYTGEFRDNNHCIPPSLISGCEDFIKAEDSGKYAYKKLRV
jgi:hypothetical protein